MRSVHDLRRGFALSRFLRAASAVVVSLSLLGSFALAQQPPTPTPPKKRSAQPPGGGAAAKAAPGPKVTTKAQPSGTAKPLPAKKPTAPAKVVLPKKPAAPPKPKYDQRPVNESLYKQRLEIQKILKADSISADQQQTLEDYYKTYALARWTSTKIDEETMAPVHLTKLPDYRKELRNDFRIARQSPAHARLVALALAYLTEVAKNENSEAGRQENYDPTARCNAMLAIGDLNQQEAPGMGASDFPTPLPEALPVLVEAFSDPNQHDAVRVAALWGIRRHALLDSIAAAEVPNIQGLMLPLAESKVEPGRTLAGHLWMRARAVAVLGALGDVGNNNAVVLALAAIVGEEDGLLLPRRAAARAIGSLAYPADNGLNPSNLAAGLGQLAVDACEAELVKIEQEKIKERRKKRRTGSGYYPGYDDYEEEYRRYSDEEEYYRDEEEDYYDEREGRTREKKEEEDTTLINRRRLLTDLSAVFFGLTGKECREWAEWQRKKAEQELPDGVAGLATAAPHKPFVDTLVERMESLCKLCAAKTKEDLLGKKEKEFDDKEKELPQKDVFRQRLEEELAQLREVLKNAPAAGAGQPAASS